MSSTSIGWKGRCRPTAVAAPHTPVYDTLYLNALDLDYATLDRLMDRARRCSEAGSPCHRPSWHRSSGFRVGERPFNKQNGDGSRVRVSQARMRIDRHIELPAGVMRVAPVETSVTGTMHIATLPMGGARATDVRLEFDSGRVVKATASQGRTS